VWCVCVVSFILFETEGAYQPWQLRAFFAGREEEYDGMFLAINLPACHESFCAF